MGVSLIDRVRGAMRGFRVGATYGGTVALERAGDWLKDLVGYRFNASGMTVTPETALTLPAYYAFIHLIARTIASLPRCVYRSLERGRERMPTHFVTYLLNEPNPEMTGMAFWETIIGHAASTGNGYAYIERNYAGTITALWLLHPSRVDVRRVENRLRYYWLNDEGQRIELLPEDVLHIHGFGSDGISGYSLVQIAAEAIGLGLARQNYAAGMFGNDTQLGTVIKHPGSLKPEIKKQMRESWMEMRKQKFTMAILDEGVDVTRMGIPPIEAQMVEAGMFSVIDICRFGGVPPHKLAALERATFSNIEHQNIEWTQDGVVPWTLRIEQECDRKLFGPRRGALYTHLNVDGLLRGDFKSRTEGYRTLLQIGVLTVNEVREKEELNPLPDGLGDMPLVQGAMVSLESVEDPPEPAPPPPPFGGPPPDQTDQTDQQDAPPEDQSASFRMQADFLRPVFLDAATRICKREAKTIERVLPKKGTDRKEWADWSDRWHRTERKHIMDAFQAPIAALAQTANASGITVRADLTPLLDQLEAAGVQRTRALAVGASVAADVPVLADGLATTVFEFVLGEDSDAD